MFTLGIAQQFVLTKRIRGWNITEQQGFPSGNEKIRNMVFAACCERLLASYNGFEL